MNTSPSVSVDIVTQIASRMGVEPWELEEPLQRVVDTDALDALVSGENWQQFQTDSRIQFCYQGYLVTVEGPMQVIIEEESPSDDDPGVDAARTRPD